jgi:four helix bundle protein
MNGSASHHRLGAPPLRLLITIAEGQGRFTVPDFRRFLSMAHGSTREVETQLLLAVRLGFARQEKAEPVLDLSAEVGRLIRGLANSFGD